MAGNGSTNNDILVANHNREAEEVVLGCMIIDDSVAIDEVLTILTPEDFYISEHQKICEAICQLTDDSTPVDLVTLGSHLEINGELAGVGGRAYLSKLAGSVTSTESVRWWASIVKDKSDKREFARLGVELQKMSGEPGRSNEDIMSAVINVLDRVEGSSAIRTGAASMSSKELAAAFFEYHAKVLQDGIPTIPTCFNNVDKVVGGYGETGTFNIVAGRSGTGKSAFAQISAIKQAQQGIKVGFISIEMSKTQVGIRASMHLEKRTKEEVFYKGAEHVKKVHGALSSFQNLPIEWMFSRPYFGDVVSEVRRMYLQEKCQVIYIDHFHRLDDGRNWSGGDQQKYNYFARRLSSTVKQLYGRIENPLALVVLCQINRTAVNSTESKRPQIHHLRDTGALEEESDLVLGLYRPELYDKENKPELKNLMQVIILKNRDGADESHVKDPELVFRPFIMQLDDKAPETPFNSAEAARAEEQEEQLVV